MPTIRIDAAELYYETTGQGEPVLLVPGLSGRGSFWASQVAELARDFRVMVHDHRGTGRSTHSRIRYSVEQMADDVMKLMDALGVDAAHLVGHSTGGAIGQVIALEHPRRLRSLVLSATWAGPDAYFRRLFESRKGVLLSQGLEAYLRASALYMSPPAWISANDALLDEQHKAALAEAAPVDVTASRIDAILRHDRRARLTDVRVPTLVIVAQDDMITPRFYSDELAKLVPGARLVVLDAGGHAAPIVSAASYNAAVGAFLRAQRPH